jgi:hypothetical protein
VIGRDLDWQRLTFEGTQDEFCWTVNAIGDTLPTPVLLRSWKKTTVDKCDLCDRKNCSLLHILNGCPVALHQGRYTWRHNQVLKLIRLAVLDGIHNANHSEKSGERVWLRSGEKPPPKDPKAKAVGHLLAGAKQWKCAFDLPSDQGVFPSVVIPPEIVASKLRPDGVIWSAKAKRIVLLELTVPFEECMEGATKRKQSRYAMLADTLRRNGWFTTVLTVEVGSRGFVGKSMNYALRALGCNFLGTTRRLISERARHCSYVIWLTRKSKVWRVISVDGEQSECVPERV